MIGGYLIPNLSRNLIHLSQNRRLPTTTTIIGSVSLSIFTSSSEPPIYIPTHNKTSYVGIPTALEDIQLLLDQRSEVQAPEVLDKEHKIDLRQANTN
ncbi:hypothetical protein Gotur_032476 [Gossypium turneri]